MEKLGNDEGKDSSPLTQRHGADSPVCENPCRHTKPSRCRKALRAVGAALSCLQLCCCRPGPIIRELAFQPPAMSTYHFYTSQGVLTLKRDEKYEHVISEGWSDRVEYFFTQSGKDRLACCYYRAPVPNPDLVLLYSHPTSCDLGMCLYAVPELSNATNCDVILYDYCGYGESTGSASDQSICKGILAVYDRVIKKYGLDPDRIVAYGQSIGSVPTTFLGQHRQVKGIILHGGLSSAFRVVLPHLTSTSVFDQFASIDRMDKINAPVLVIHGTDDEVVPYASGLQLYGKAVNKVEPLWVKGGGHNDLESTAVYWDRLVEFLQIDLMGRSQVQLDEFQKLTIRRATLDFYCSRYASITESEETETSDEWEMMIAERVGKDFLQSIAMRKPVPSESAPGNNEDKTMIVEGVGERLQENVATATTARPDSTPGRNEGKTMIVESVGERLQENVATATTAPSESAPGNNEDKTMIVESVGERLQENVATATTAPPDSTPDGNEGKMPDAEGENPLLV